jgi:hypothetical protein
MPLRSPEAAIRRRLSAYHEQTGPVFDWYVESVVQTIDGVATRPRPKGLLSGRGLSMDQLQEDNSLAFHLVGAPTSD